ncbi:peroxidase 42-like [Prunus dulcis]|uniref:peroxidase 42-like n=1 Tax=Prunus dulcis TaxID=3755 RepID=UPI0014825A7F|nr:peroxidase 42-like [Prunus dulcis]
MSSRALFFFALLAFSAVSCFAENEEDPGLVMDFYKDSCPQAEDVIREQVKLLYKRHKNTAFSWLRNIFHDCAVQSCDASLLLDSTRRSLSEKEMDRSFGMRNFRYIEEIKEALERECPGVVSCSDILVLSAREGVVRLGGPNIPLKTGRRDGRRSRAEILEQYLPDHNESMSTVLEKFADMGIDTPGLVALLGAHSVGRTHCVKLVHRLYPEVDPQLNPDHVGHMLKKCPDAIKRSIGSQIRVGAMAADEGKMKIEKFDGADFGFWKMQIEDYLYQKKLYQPLSENKPEGMNDEDWTLLDRQAL